MSGTFLLTGATGFIGGRIARRLRAQGEHVRCLVRPESDGSALADSGAELVAGDLRDEGTLREAARDARCVIHCAALVSDWATVQEIVAANVTGTRALVRAALATRVERFVHLSSTDVYGHPGAGAVAESRLPLGFRNWYAHTKLAAEREVRVLARPPLVEAAILRPATVYGPGSVDVVGEIAAAIGRRQMMLVDGGRPIAGLCYVENLVDAVLTAARPGAATGAFNITDGLQVTWRRFCDDLAAGLGAPPVRFSVPYGPAACAAFVLETGYRLLRRATGLRTEPLLSRQAVQVLGIDQDFSAARARDELGWEPRVGYEEGMAQTLAWLRERAHT